MFEKHDVMLQDAVKNKFCLRPLFMEKKVICHIQRSNKQPEIKLGLHQKVPALCWKLYSLQLIVSLHLQPNTAESEEMTCCSVLNELSRHPIISLFPIWIFHNKRSQIRWVTTASSSHQYLYSSTFVGNEGRLITVQLHKEHCARQCALDSSFFMLAPQHS